MKPEQRTNAATQAKKRWNSSHYTAVKVSIKPDVAAAFKEACAVANVSMAGELSRHMAEYSDVALERKVKPDYSTRRQRRAAMRDIIQRIERIRDAEERSRDNIPENLRGAAVYETSEETISTLDEMIELLSSTY